MSIINQSVSWLICKLNHSGDLWKLFSNELPAMANDLIFHFLVLSEHLDVCIFVLEFPLLFWD
jgi:hypothetical protein